jgi:methylmalonyl-CoA mutase cobalamin-binding domain/chain
VARRIRVNPDVRGLVLEDEVYNPDNFRRKLRDQAADEGGGRSGQDGDPSSALSLSAMAASVAHPVFGRFARPPELPVDAPPPGGYDPAADADQRRRPVADRLHLVPPATLPQALDRRERVARQFSVLADQVIPHLVKYHAQPPAVPAMKPTEAEFEEFFGHLLEDHESGFVEAIRRMIARGLSVECIYLDLLVPCAVRMGQRWVDDCSDFVAVTVAVGRLQALLRQFSPEFRAEVSRPPAGRRVLLSQPDDETHMFGLSVVAEFFRRDGWDVVGGVAGTGIDPVQWVREERFDVVGLSVGSELKLPWLSERIAALRRASCNPDLVVMVGGPIFSADPANVQRVGADLTSRADTAPAMAEEFLMRKASAAQQLPSSRSQP